MDTLGHPGRREAAIAVTVAAIVLLVAWLMDRADPSGQSGDLTALAGQADADVVQLDVSNDISQAQIAACQGGQVTVKYAELQKSGTGAAPALIVQDSAGQLHLCDASGHDTPSTAPVELADGTHAVRLLSNGRQSWDCDGNRLSALTVAHWLSVSDQVKEVRMRFLIDGASGPWFATVPQGGFVHLEASLGQQNPGAELKVQVAVLGKGGDRVAQDAFPVTPTPLSGCATGGVQLG